MTNLFNNPLAGDSYRCEIFDFEKSYRSLANVHRRLANWPELADEQFVRLSDAANLSANQQQQCQNKADDSPYDPAGSARRRRRLVVLNGRKRRGQVSPGRDVQQQFVAVLKTQVRRLRFVLICRRL